MSKVLTVIALAFVLLATGLAQQPAAPALTPHPEWTHKKLGVFVYPAKGQKPEQQQKDETECYTSCRSQTGIDPTGPPTAAAPTPAQPANPGEERE